MWTPITRPSFYNFIRASARAIRIVLRRFVYVPQKRKGNKCSECEVCFQSRTSNIVRIKGPWSRSLKMNFPNAMSHFMMFNDGIRMKFYLTNSCSRGSLWLLAIQIFHLNLFTLLSLLAHALSLSLHLRIIQCALCIHTAYSFNGSCIFPLK